MKIARTVARIVLGILFVGVAIMGVVMTPPPTPGLAGTLQDALHASHWSIFIAAAQFVAGVLLLVGRYIPLAVVILCGFLYNSFAFHLLTMPAALPVPIVVLALLIFVAWPYRRVFAYVFSADPDPAAIAR